jgi:hypothetical protein
MFMYLKTSKIYKRMHFFPVFLPLSELLICILSVIVRLCIFLASPISARYFYVFLSLRHSRKHHKALTPVLSPAVAMDEESEVIRIEALCKSLYESQNAGERQEAEKALVTFQNSSGQFFHVNNISSRFLEFRYERIIRIA